MLNYLTELLSVRAEGIERRKWGIVGAIRKLKPQSERSQMELQLKAAKRE